MSKTNNLIVAASLLLISFFVRAETQDVAQNNNEEIIKNTFETVMKENDIPGMAVSLYVDGKPSSYYFGYANREKKFRVTKNTIFELGSISKVMTSLLFAQQLDVAKVSLNDSVRKYLKELPDAFDDITLQDLATHTSGLPFSVPETVKSRSDLEKYLTTWSPEEAPQDQWTYSNFGIGLLGYAMETVTHRDFDQLYRKRIVNPLGMQPNALTIPDASKRFYAQGYDTDGKPTGTVQMDVFASAGAIKASADDMRRFLSAAIGLPGTPERILYPMRMTQAVYVELPDKMQGLGWQIYELKPEKVKALISAANPVDLHAIPVKHIFDKPTYNGADLIDKTGSTRGFRAYIAIIPNKKAGIVVLANRALSNNAIVQASRKVLFKLTNIITDEEAPVKSEGKEAETIR